MILDREYSKTEMHPHRINTRNPPKTHSVTMSSFSTVETATAALSSPNDFEKMNFNACSVAGIMRLPRKSVVMKTTEMVIFHSDSTLD